MNRINVSTLQTPSSSVQPSARTWQQNQLGLSSKSIMSNLSQSIALYQQNLLQFQEYLQISLQKNNNVRCKCQNTLMNGVNRLKSKFSQFANQWKNQLPHVCKQFMEIVQKICKLYQQQIQRLSQTNQKWQFSYKQLLKASSAQAPQRQSQVSSAVKQKQGRKTTNQKLINISKQIQRCRTPQNQNPNNMPSEKQKSEEKKPIQIQNKSQSVNPVQLKHLCKLDDFIKIKDSQISLMRQQITQLFEQESIDRSDLKPNKLHCKILTQEIKIIDEIKQFRLKTSSDQQPNSNSNSNHLNNGHPNTIQNTRNIINLTNNKCSLPNSRKNSFVNCNSKQLYWQNNIANNLGTSNSNGAIKLNKSHHTYGKQNTQFVFKERASAQAKQKFKEQQKLKQQKQKMQRAGSSKLQDLKRNLYKNKTLSEYRS